jgi:hypothetical protein
MTTSLSASLLRTHETPLCALNHQPPIDNEQNEPSLPAQADPLWPLVTVLGEVARRVCLQSNSDQPDITSEV